MNLLKIMEDILLHNFIEVLKKSLCTSLNHVVCHGIPSNRILEDGDALKY